VNTLSLEAGDARSFEQAGVLTNTSLLVVPVEPVVTEPEPEPAVPVAPVVSLVSTSSSNGSSSSSSGGVGFGGAAGNVHKRSRGALTTSVGDEEVIDLLSPQPPRKMPAKGRIDGGGGNSSSSGNGSSGAGQGVLFTPHRPSGDAVIDLTLS